MRQVMETNLTKSILTSIKQNNLISFSVYDFLSLGNYKAISKCLERMEDDKKIRRIIPGIYDLNIIDEYFNITKPIDIEAVAYAIARKYMWRIIPSEATAANLLGLTTQVSATYTYLSDGPYREYQIGNNTIRFKHTTIREISSYSLYTSLLIEAIRYIGHDCINNSNILLQLRKALTKEQKEIALKETIKLTVWIREVIKKVCEDE